MSRTWLPCLLLFALACGGPSRAVAPAPTEGPPAPPVATPAPAPTPFVNPGGMWLPEQLAAKAELLERLGLELPATRLADPTGAPLGAVASLGGCTASFVSPDGLLVTNHHCVTGNLQYHSSPEHDYFETGFLAATRADEKWNGPAAKVWVTQKISDVSPAMLGGLESIADPGDRADELEARETALVAACEKDRPSMRCTVVADYGGGAYRLIEKLEIRDLRLVYAPAAGIGWFGGNVDNWMWPRHTGDFAFLRAYVGPDGAPADHSDDNVPYQPPQHLTIATGDLDAGDFVMVAGYPGRTYRLETAADVRAAIDWFYPTRIAAYQAYLDTIEAVTARHPEASIKAMSTVAGLANYKKKYEGTLAGLEGGGFAARVEAKEAELRAWIEADADRKARYRDLFAGLDAVAAREREHRDVDTLLADLTRHSRLLDAASTIVRMAEERALPDAERDPRYQQRNWDKLRAGLTTLDKRYHPALDRALLKTMISRGKKLPAVASVLGILFRPDLSDRAVDRALGRLYGNTTLEREAVRLRLFDRATPASLAKSRDPFIVLARKLLPMQKEREERDDVTTGELALIMPRYLEAVRAHAGEPVAPDANGSLRVTFGTVRGVDTGADGEPASPFTTLPGVVAKHTGERPFDVPDALLAAAKAGRFGSYVDPDLGQVPVDFLTDLDITGGNSGSPTLDARGHLCGLAFDTTYESVASDWVFSPELNRAIHVDIRYALWVMDAVDGADRLLEEMGVEPAL